MKLADDIKSRDKSHGCFSKTARISQSIKWVFRQEKDWTKLTHIQMEALDCIAMKMARIISGNNDWQDSWYDIQGYSELARQDAESRSKKPIRRKNRSKTKRLKNGFLQLAKKLEKVNALRKTFVGISMADACLMLGYDVKEIEVEKLKRDPTVEYLRNIFGMK